LSYTGSKDESNTRNLLWLDGVIPAYSAEDNGTYCRAMGRYLEKRMMGSTALDLLLATLDLAVAACVRRDTEKLLKTLGVLERSLVFDAAPELAGLLVTIYGYCRQLVREERFGEAFTYMSGLRDAWMEAGNRILTRKQRDERRASPP
jgi:hypothetical protein